VKLNNNSSIPCFNKTRGSHAYLKDFADNSIKKENWGKKISIKLGVPMPYLRNFAGNSTMKENSVKRISTKLGVPMPYLRDFVDNSIMKENQGKRIVIKLRGSHALFEGLCR